MVTAVLQNQDDESVVDALLVASRALVAIAARSLAEAGDVTLPQYRMLVVLATRGPQRPADLADALAVNRSTASRMCDRLLTKRLIRRTRLSSDRRVLRISLTTDGARLVAKVMRKRRTDLATAIRGLTAEQRGAVVVGLSTFAEALGEPRVPEDHWGWDLRGFPLSHPDETT